MNVFVSGVAARAVFVDQQRVTYIDAEWPDRVHQASYECLGHLLSDAPDILELKNIGYAEALAHLLERWNSDRALRMLQLVQLPGDESEDSSEAFEYLDALLANEYVTDHVLNYALAVPADKVGDVFKIAPLAAAWQRAYELVKYINGAQNSIRHIRQAWEALAPELFTDANHRAQFEKLAVERGIFRGLVEAHLGGAKINDVILSAYVVFANQRGSRSIMQAWERAIGIPREKSKIAFVELDGDLSDIDPHVPMADVSARAEYEKVRRSIQAITERLRKKDISRAKRFADELIEDQIRKGGSQFAVKSLCALSQEAKTLGFNSLALDWVIKATEVAPLDGWSHGQAGDILLSLHRFEDANRFYTKASERGEAQFAATGWARVLRATYRLEEALAAYESTRLAFPDHSEVYRTYAGIGEVQREMGRLDAALATYDEGISRFPNEPVLWCGRAATLKEQGELDLALKAYQKAIERFPTEAYAWSGVADVLKLLGEFESALLAYEDVIKRFPDECIGYSGHADVRRQMGDITGAIDEYEKALNRFENEPAAYSGYAEALKDAGRLREALSVYNRAIDRFAFEPQPKIGKANVLRHLGELELSLSAYDEATRSFPFSLHARLGRAHILKELGRYDLALEAFDAASELRPDLPSPRYQKASVLTILGRFSEAERLLPTTQPRTRDQWVAEHVRGMLLLKSGRRDEAVNVFTRGVLRNQFERERRYFQNALSVAQIMKKQYRAAFDNAKSDDGVLAKVLRFHSAAALGRKSDAARDFKSLSSDPHPTVVALSQEIAARFGIEKAAAKYSESWINEKEIEVALQMAA